MAPSLGSMVFSLRRKAVRERTELAAEDFAFAFYLQWKRVARSEIEVIDLMRELSPRTHSCPISAECSATSNAANAPARHPRVARSP